MPLNMKPTGNCRLTIGYPLVNQKISARKSEGVYVYTSSETSPLGLPLKWVAKAAIHYQIYYSHARFPHRQGARGHLQQLLQFQHAKLASAA
jgi:hypothetical protein